MTLTDETEVSAETLADWLGCRPRQIREWAQAGLVARSERGRYLLRASVVGVVRHLRSVAAGRGDGALDLASERALLARAQREATEQRTAERRRELVDAAEPEREMISLATMVSGRLQGVPSAIAPELFAAASAAECEAICVRAVDDALRDMAERAQRDLTRLEAATREEIQDDDE